jgi:hypothetical protein
MPYTNTRKFAVTYDSQELAADDLCVFAAGKILTGGAVAGAFIEITRFDPEEGAIEFTCTNSSPSFTGIINTIRFKAKENGSTKINITCILE